MAPRKRKADGEAEPPNPAAEVSQRLTRRSSRLANANSVATQQHELKKKKAYKTKKEKVKETKAEEVKEPESEKEEADGSAKTIVIEHCKQCTQFKIRAIKVKEGLEKAVPGITVMLNPDKPRRGCFEIRVEGGDTFISLLDMKRPFQPMKKLDMEQVIFDIVEKVK